MAERSHQQDRLKVFISYSRADLAFADQLIRGLELCGFDPTIDRTELEPGVTYRPELVTLIREAGTIVFVLSPESLASPNCAWEVEQAAALNKRILPAVCKPLGDAPIPDTLAALQFTHFYTEVKFPGTGWGDGLARLSAALNTDIEWVREHTLLQEQAARWEAGKRAPDRLLKGSDITSAKAWLSRRPAKAPEPTALQRDFIDASEQEELHQLSTRQQQLADMAAAQERERRALEKEKTAVEQAAREQEEKARLRRWVFTGMSAVVVILAALTGTTAYFGREASTGRAEAVREKRDAEGARENALEQKRLAEEARMQSEMRRVDLENSQKEVVRAQQRLLAGAAKQSITAGDAATGMLIALEAMSTSLAAPDAPMADELPLSLYKATYELRERTLVPLARRGALSPDGNRIVVAYNGRTAHVHDARTGQRMGQLEGHGAKIEQILFSQDGARILTVSQDGSSRLWDSASLRPGPVLDHERVPPVSAAFDPKGNLVAVASRATVRVWSADTGERKHELKGHAGDVRTVAFSPDGQTLVTGSEDKTAIVWDLSSGRSLHVLSGHTAVVNSASFSPDGSQILTASKDKTARVWDMATGREVFLLEGHSNDIPWVGFTPDGKTIASVSLDRTARLWNAQTGKQQDLLAGHDKAIKAGTFSPDGRYLATASDDMTVRIWEVATGEGVATLAGHTGAVTGVAFDGTSRRVLSVSDREGTARLWDVSVTPTAHVLNGMQDGLRSATFAADGTHILVQTAQNAYQLWDADSRERIDVPAFQDGRTRTAAFNPKGDRILVETGSSALMLNAMTGRLVAEMRGNAGDFYRHMWFRDGLGLVTRSRDNRIVLLWNPETGQLVRRLDGYEGPVDDWASSRAGNRFYVRSKGFFYVFDREMGDFVRRLGRLDSNITHAGISDDARRIFSVHANDSISLWNVDTGEEKPVEGVFERPLIIPAWGRGRIIVWSRGTATIQLWNTETLQLVKTLELRNEHPMSVKISPDGQVIAASFYDRTVHLWAIDTGAELPIILRHEDRVATIAFSSDNRWLATAADKTVYLWERAGGQFRQSLKGHTGAVTGVAFSGDNRRILTWAEDNTALLWSVATGGAVAVLQIDSPTRTVLIVSPDGRTIAATDRVDNSSVAKLWSVPDSPGQLAATARRLLTRCLTIQQGRDQAFEGDPPEWCTQSGNEKWPYDQFTRGDRHRFREEFDDAIAAYRRVLTMDPGLKEEVIPSLFRAYMGLASQFALQDKPEPERIDAAITAIDRAIEFDDRVVEAYFIRGLLLSHLRRGEEAEAVFAKAFQMETPTQPCYFYRGRARELLGKTTAAIQDYETVVKWPAPSNIAFFKAEAEKRLTSLGAVPTGRQRPDDWDQYVH